MPVASITSHRRCQGEFIRTLDRRPAARAHRGEPRLRPLTVRNAAQAFSVALLMGGLVPPTRGVRAPAAADTHALRPALLPGAGATGDAHGYAAVATAEPLVTTVNAAAIGCLARPRSCPQLLATALISGVGGVAAGACAGWLSARQHMSCADDAPPAEAPRAEALSAAAQASQAQVRRNVHPLAFRPSDLDTAQDPCQSLYAYVNTRWANATRLREHQNRWHTAGEMLENSLQQQRALAESLVEREHLSPAQRIVADLWSSGMDGFHLNVGLPQVLRDELAQIKALDSVEAIAAHLRRLTAQGRNPVFGLSVEPDMDDRGTLMAYIYQGALGLPDAAFYLGEDETGMREVYRSHVTRLLRLSGISTAQAATDASAVLALEQRLAEASATRATLAADVGLFHNPVTLDAANAITPHFNWTTLFETLGERVPTHFSLGMPAFQRAFDTALVDTAPSVWRSYLRVHSLDLASPYLSDGFANAAHALQQRLGRTPQPLPPRWKRVLAAIDAHAGAAMSEVYAAAHFSADTRQRVERMAAQLRTVLKRRLGTLPWMDEATRVTAQAKAEQLDPLIGHPRSATDWSGLRTERCGYLDNLQRAQAHQTRARIAKIGQRVDQLPSRLRAHSVEAYFDVLPNEMAFAAGLLQPPVFDPAADDALNYGAAGVTLGHEMAHAFSAETSSVAPDRTLRLWWTPDDLQRYRDLAQRLAAQFDQQQVDGLPINGTLTSNENMADLGGLVLALDALHEQVGAEPDPMIDGLSREQRFMLSYGLLNRRLQTRQRLELELALSPHALGAPRADVGPSNMQAYADAFQCAPGTPMARTEEERVLYL